jgi:hypothetical protein
MNVTTEAIRNIKAGQIKPFVCEDGKKLQSAATLISATKRLGMPEGVVDYAFQKFFEENVILVHALGEGEEKVLNK